MVTDTIKNMLFKFTPTHGFSDALAFRNALKQAAEAAKYDMTPELEKALQLLAQAKEPGND